MLLFLNMLCPVFGNWRVIDSQEQPNVTAALEIKCLADSVRMVVAETMAVKAGFLAELLGLLRGGDDAG
jgi:hypothetical protein